MSAREKKLRIKPGTVTDADWLSALECEERHCAAFMKPAFARRTRATINAVRAALAATCVLLILRPDGVKR